MKKYNNIRPNGLKGNETVDRMRSLMNLSPINENKSHSVVELSKLGPNGRIYGIVRENHKYFIKVANNKPNLVTEDFKYIGGLQNKTEISYDSYSKALKQLNLMFISINESLGERHHVDVFKNDNLLSEEFVSYNEDPKPSQPDTLMGTVKSVGKNDGHDKEIIGDAGKNTDTPTPPVVEDDESENCEDCDVVNEEDDDKTNVSESWDTDTKIKHTGENTDKTIKELESELASIKAKSKKYQDKGESVPENIKKKEHQLNFAIRAKKNWPKGKTESYQTDIELTETEKAIDKMILEVRNSLSNTEIKKDKPTIKGGGLSITTAINKINEGANSGLKKKV